MNNRTGVFLINLGTPDSPEPRDVYRYLIEFLTDPRVIIAPWLKRQLLVRGLIVPLRYRQSAKAYQKIWTAEGSPLKVYGDRIRDRLQDRLGDEFKIVIGMRYQKPSIEDGLRELLNAQVERILVFPLFPQYASATTGSIHQKVMELVSGCEVIPEMLFMNQFATHPSLINAFCASAEPYKLNDYEHILFSFHGLPHQHLIRADRCGHCLKSEDCCKTLTSANQSCYSAQCYSTAHAIAKNLTLESNRFSVAFQSRLGKEPWLEPSTADVIKQLALNGKKKVLVFCPSFVCDCLETIYEIGIEYEELFKHHGGERLDLVPGLNDNVKWIDALEEIIQEKLLL